MRQLIRTWSPVGVANPMEMMMRAAGAAVSGNIVRWAAMGCLALFLMPMGVVRAEALGAGRAYYVDSAAGRDGNDGLAADRAWRSLERVNAAALKPGDTVRFRRGRQWRGSLVPASGDESGPITYTAFGEGEKPLLLGSLPRSRPQDWVQVAGKIWATLPMEYQPGQSVADLKNGAWGRHQEAGARVAFTTTPDAGGATIRLVCAQSGSASNHIQLWGPTVPVEKGATLLFTFRARSTRPLRLSGINITEGPRRGGTSRRPAASAPSVPNGASAECRCGACKPRRRASFT